MRNFATTTQNNPCQNDKCLPMKMWMNITGII